MAGRLSNCRYCRAALVFMTLALTLTVLVTTKVWDPIPVLNAWWAKFSALSEPAPAWAARVGGAPDLAAVMRNGEVVVANRGFVEGYGKDKGDLLWRYEVHWALPAVDVVVARQRPTNPDDDKEPDTGYSVIEPSRGAVIWGDRDAIAVWAFSDRIVDLVCPGPGDCQLRARAHRDNGRVLWSVSVPPGARTIRGPNPPLVGSRDPAEWFAVAASGTPGFIPPVFALAVDGRIQLVDSFNGVRVREVTAPDRETRVALSGDSLLLVHAERATSGCRFRVEAYDFRSGEPTWKEEGFDLDTASGAGCEQRRDPLGADRHLIVTGAENRPMLIEADTAAPKWIGVPGERVLATGYGIAVVESADRKTVNVIDVLSAGRAATWSGEMGLEPEASVTADFVMIRDGDAGRLIVFRRIGMEQRLNIETKATVVGYGSGGVVLASGRRIGFYPITR